MEKSQRSVAANKFKSAFNLLWDQAITINEQKGQQGTISYRDIVRIADACRAEGPKILGLTTFPQQIDSGLKFACAAIDPDKARAKETIKQGLGGLVGASGLALAWLCLGNLLNPGIWAVIAAFFVGGIPGGPMPIVGIAAGLFLAAGAVYAAFQKMSPEERSVKAHDYVMKGVDNWVEYGSEDIPVSSEEAQTSIGQYASEKELSPQDLIAFATLMMNVANADGVFAAVEQQTINLLLGGVDVDKRLKKAEAIQHIKCLDQHKAAEVMTWCFEVAHADGVFHTNEVEALKRYCQELNVDFTSNATLYGVKIDP